MATQLHSDAERGTWLSLIDSNRIRCRALPFAKETMRVTNGLRIVGLGVALVALASLVGNALLGNALYRSVAKLNQLRVFPLGAETNNYAITTSADTRRSIAMWGDSRAYLWDAALLATRLHCLNFAHGAQTSSQLLLQLETAPAFHTDVALVQIGINDLHPLGALQTEKGRILAQLQRNLRSIRDQLSARADIVVLTTIMPPDHVPLQRRLFWDGQTLQYITEFNRQLESLVDNKKIFLLDANALLRDNDGFLDAHYVDHDFFLHVNAAAYQVLNAHLLRIVTTAHPLSAEIK